MILQVKIGMRTIVVVGDLTFKVTKRIACIRRRLTEMLADTLHAAFEDRKETFDRVRVNGTVSLVTIAVRENLVTREARFQVLVVTSIVRHYDGPLGDVFPHNRNDRLAVNSINL
jgi:hypothetical protein